MFNFAPTSRPPVLASVHLLDHHHPTVNGWYDGNIDTSSKDNANNHHHHHHHHHVIRPTSTSRFHPRLMWIRRRATLPLQSAAIPVSTSTTVIVLHSSHASPT
ncbi:unnamed protein product [Linum trigynum]